MTKLKPPASSALLDLEWARVYADRIKGELKLIAKTLSELNVHGMHPHLAKGAVLLKAQMKHASQQVGGMRKIASQCESNWMDTIKKALAASKKNRQEQIVKFSGANLPASRRSGGERF